MAERDPVAVNSTWVKSIQYSNGLLTVYTKTGRQYTYVAVPQYLWEQLQASDSKGKFINDKIKGRFNEA